MRGLEEIKSVPDGRVIYSGNRNYKPLIIGAFSFLFLLFFLSFLVMVLVMEKIISANSINSNILISVVYFSGFGFLLLLILVCFFFFFPWAARDIWLPNSAEPETRSKGLEIARNWRKKYGKMLSSPVTYKSDIYHVGLKRIKVQNGNTLGFLTVLPPFVPAGGVENYFDNFLREIQNRFPAMLVEGVGIEGTSANFLLIIRDKTNEVREVTA